MTNVAFFATAAKGLEEVLADELRALGVSNVLPGIGGVHFHGNPADGYRACLWLRSTKKSAASPGKHISPRR
jgi:23S rRNA G2445 N2-methylase RlmL